MDEQGGMYCCNHPSSRKTCSRTPSVGDWPKQKFTDYGSGKCERNDQTYDAALMVCPPSPQSTMLNRCLTGAPVQRWSFFSHRHLHPQPFSIVLEGKGGRII